MMLIILQLRCSGQRSGCDRCKAVGYPCVYSPAAHSRDPRKVNKRGTPAWRKAVKRRGFVQHTEEVDCHKDLSSHNHLDDYQHGLGHSLNQKDNQENDPQGQQKLHQQGSPDTSKANTTNESSIQKLPHILTDFGSEHETLYGHQLLSSVDILDYSIGVNNSWVSFDSSIGDTYFANPVGVAYDAFEYGNIASDHLATSLLPHFSSSEFSQAQESVAMTSVSTPDINVTI